MSTEQTPAAVAPASKPIRIPPIATTDSRFFWDAANEEKFVGQQCGDCGAYAFPPRPMCPQCYSLNRQVVPLSGRGRVHAWVIPRHPAPFGFREAPIVAVIELEEGFRFVSNVVCIAPEALVPDMPVQVAFEDTMNKMKVPVFKPCAAAAGAQA
jgi:hypothetical protein